MDKTYICLESVIALLQIHKDKMRREKAVLSADEDEIIRFLKTVPPEDVAPVVRCKDCAEWQKEWEPRKANNGEHFCANVGLITAPEWYCADGNREGGWK